MRSDVLTVSEYSSRLGQALRQVGGATLEGEVQKVNVVQRSGMIFFDLTDEGATLTCKVFPRDAARLEHQPRQGDLVQVQVDRPDLWAQRGELSLIASAVSLAGEGELLRRRQALIERLKAEGLCDPGRRRALPTFPRAVGVIAGAGSDGMSDVVRALADRWPAVHVITCASLVQGVHAPRAVINALALLQEHPLVDVIVVARGGGSVQDLACFDDEGLCRTLFACETPVVCAIGHTDNNPVCNHVTWSAYTPSRSAEMVVPALTDVRQVLARATDRLDRIPGQLQLGRERVEAVSRHLDVEGILDERRIAVRQSAALGAGALTTRLTSRAHAIELAHAILSSVPRSAALELSNERETLVSASATLAQTRARVTALATETADLARQAQAGVNAGLKDAARELAHLTEVIAARDFRRRGWLLAGDKDGQPVRSVADLEAGSRIHLQLHDGGAEAAVKEINPVARTT